jgi:polyisoprenoid-binding protein YceI
VNHHREGTALTIRFLLILLERENKMRAVPLLFSAVLTVGASTSAFAAASLSDAAGRYTLSADRSSLAFSIHSVAGAGISGKFGRFTGLIDIDPSDVGGSSVTITIMPASVKTGQERIDSFLKSNAVFDVADNPAIRFRSTAVRRTGEKTATITGLLTARGHTGPATFNAELSSLSGNAISFHVSGRVFRSPYGMDVGTPIYSNVVNFEMELVGKRR